MSNHLYPLGRQRFLSGDLDWDAHTIKASLVKGTYVQSDAHEFITSVDTGGNVLATQTLGTKTVTLGVADAADSVFPAVAGGDTVTGIVVWRDTGTPATSPLIGWIDTNADTTPIAWATTGADITVAWPAGADRIFRL